MFSEMVGEPFWDFYGEGRAIHAMNTHDPGISSCLHLLSSPQSICRVQEKCTYIPALVKSAPDPGPVTVLMQIYRRSQVFTAPRLCVLCSLLTGASDERLTFCHSLATDLLSCIQGNGHIYGVVQL
jgi:hypothetical protein